MYFDFESRRFETPTVEPAMSYRECALLSFFTHLLLALLVLVGPRLAFVQEAMERRAQRLAELVELAEAERLALRPVPDDAPEFIFVDTLVDPPALASPSGADLSDQDRVAQSRFLRVAREEMERADVQVPLLVSRRALIENHGPLGRVWFTIGGGEPRRALTGC